MLKRILQAIASVLSSPAPTAEARVSRGDVVRCGAILGYVKGLEVDRESGAIDAVISTFDMDGQWRDVRVPADGRYEVDLEVITSKGQLYQG